MNYIFGDNNILSYMFYNCYNLENFTYDLDYSISHTFKNLTGMFYNCLSLQSFQFKNLYMDFYHYSSSTSYDPKKSHDVTYTTY